MRPLCRSRLAVESLERRLSLTADTASGLVATPVSASEIGLTWRPADGGAVAVIVERRCGPSDPFIAIAALAGGETIFTDTGCWAGTSYTYRVRMQDADGSVVSAECSASSFEVPLDAFSPPVSLSVTARTWTTVDVSFADVNGGQASHLLERSADGASWSVVASLGAATSWHDTGLVPGEDYWYRVRSVGWTKPTSDYSVPAAVVMPNRPLAMPIAPAAVMAVAISASGARISWQAVDTQTVQYAVERSVDYDPWHPVQWSRVAVTAAGATSYVDTGLRPETPYVYRVRAIRDGVQSEPGSPAHDVMHVLFGEGVGIVTASRGSGMPRTYDIGPGLPLTRLGDLDWTNLGPGDVVNIHATPGGYHELLQISARGTPDAWITINGVPDPVTGERPVIDAADAVLAPQFRNHYAPLHGSGAIVIGARPGFVQGYKPGHVEIRNLDVRNCHSTQSFTDVDGTIKPYGRVGAGIYLERCDNVRISGCAVYDNGEGIFGAGQSGFDRIMTDITIDGNRIWGNGNVGSDREHNTYIEAIDVVYQFNRYGPLRAGALGAGLKDRSVGTIIRYNRIEGGAHQLQIPEPQNQADLAIALTRPRVTVVAGNTLVAPAGNGASPIWFGGDQGLTPWYRKGVLAAFHNTIVTRSDRSQVWKINAIEAASAGEVIEARNNVFAAIPAISDRAPPDFGLVGRDNRAAFGRNWVTPGWRPTTSGDYSFVGHLSGTEHFLIGADVDPGFIDVATGDYRLAAGSVCIDAGSPLPGWLARWPVNAQFVAPSGGEARPIIGGAADLGGFEAGLPGHPPPTAPTPSPSPPPAAPSRLRARVMANGGIRLEWRDRSGSETGFVVERSRSGGAWERIATTAANTKAFVDQTAVRGVRYAYRIRALGGGPFLPTLSPATSIVSVRLPLRGR